MHETNWKCDFAHVLQLEQGEFERAMKPEKQTKRKICNQPHMQQTNKTHAQVFFKKNKTKTKKRRTPRKHTRPPPKCEKSSLASHK